ncbi:uncharacterized protein MELLADRAFT_67210 [Melampsora larici-populina 98AG31]|uniref:Uncharacterized protein n=1 Tax=Melampsora larici-populina (strain 98AG31 / pathotype 3-4-7) TaxID=747676 RepID=F4S273_MELLP|nr:uncharacterized protein MELLADRAFT_67210 [Melampsora larici-populina 98AG31]EGG01254.1 hypothetical protein MELLADRAFT_67210 [Melampsora larici-populina 98AG31]
MAAVLHFRRPLHSSTENEDAGQPGTGIACGTGSGPVSQLCSLAHSSLLVFFKSDPCTVPDPTRPEPRALQTSKPIRTHQTSKNKHNSSIMQAGNSPIESLSEPTIRPEATELALTESQHIDPSVLGGANNKQAERSTSAPPVEEAAEKLSPAVEGPKPRAAKDSVEKDAQPSTKEKTTELNAAMQFLDSIMVEGGGALKDLHFKKDDSTDATRGESQVDEGSLTRDQLIELKRAQYAKMARTYHRLKTAMKEEGVDEDKQGIEGEVEDLTGSLARVKFSLDTKGRELDRLISKNDPDIQITSALIVVPDPTPKRGQNVATKRKVPMGKAKSVATTVNPSMFLDLEAEEGEDSSDDNEKKRPAKKPRQDPKSSEFVTEADDPKLAQSTSKKEEVVEAKAIKKAKKSGTGEKPKKPSVYKMPESKFCIYARKNVDITAASHLSLFSIFNCFLLILCANYVPRIILINGPCLFVEITTSITQVEAEFIERMEKKITNNSFNWGETLSQPVKFLLCRWSYDSATEHGKPTFEDLEPHILMMKSFGEDDEFLWHLKGAPRLMQVSSQDPYFAPELLKWDLISKSKNYVWDKTNGLFRALHGMCCRFDTSTDWTDEPTLLKQIRDGYTSIRTIYNQGLQHISSSTIHDNIEIEVEGDLAVPEEFVPFSQACGWIYQQIVMNTDPEESDRKIKTSKRDLAALQRRYFLVLLGIMMVYESHMYNAECVLAEQRGMSGEELADYKKKTSELTCLNQLVRANVKNKIILMKKSKTSKKITAPPAASTELIQNDGQLQVSTKEVSLDLSLLRKEALQSLALFLTFGTSGLIHVWTRFKDQNMHEAVRLIMLSTMFMDQKGKAKPPRKHVFGDRAWARLDNHVYCVLRKFMNGHKFATDIRWPQMTSIFTQEFDFPVIAKLFTLDLFTEFGAPKCSRGINGLVVNEVDIKSKTKQDWDPYAPHSESFRRIFGPTEGPPKAVKRNTQAVDVNLGPGGGFMRGPPAEQSGSNAPGPQEVLDDDDGGSEKSVGDGEEESEQEEE